jgi:ABC-type nitrate/sulfonate/bicarbonate transport system permease component
LKLWLQRFWRRALGWLVLVAIWSFLTDGGFADPLFLASPRSTFSALAEGVLSGGLVAAALATLWRASCGFLIASVVGTSIGLALGGISWVRDTLGGIVDALRSLPATALFPVFLLVLGIGDKAKIAVVVFVCMWAMAIYTAAGVREASTVRRFLLRLHDVGQLQYFWDGLFLPALPTILGGMRASISLSLVITIGIEMIVGTSSGLGQSIYMAQLTYKISDMYAAILVSAFLGFVVNRLFLFLSSRLVKWDLEAYVA